MNASTPSPQLIIALIIILVFAVAYFMDPTNEVMKGALIAGFAGAWGYFLGSSSGSKSNGDVVRRIAEQPSVVATGDQPTINAPGVAPDGELPPDDRVRP